MSNLPSPPSTYLKFIERHPKLGEAWEKARDAGAEGPLDERSQRLVKLGIAAGSLREGAVHSAVRKALAAGVDEDEIAQVVALVATTLGFPAAVTVFSWVRDITDKE